MISNTAPVRVSFFKHSMMRKRIRSSKRWFGLVILLGMLVAKTLGAGLDSSVQQLIVSVGADWDASTGKLQFFERSGNEWKAAGPVIPVLYGKNGLVWGRGVLGTDEPGTHKQEHDGRAPAGVFRIGTIYTYDNALPEGAKYPFHTVNAADAWVDDIKSPDYNKHVAIPDPSNPPPWFEKQKMRHGDAAYRWLVEIRHNADPPVANGGSAIFFHIRRGPDRKTAGCTTMAEDNLVKLVRWLRADKHPNYALLPKSEYEAKWKAWGLPSPQEAAGVMP
jgi:L,D-peptidoglycan transpeptidase YkuD (ErfK/YbiS/YcfS/YnhG family)